MLIFSQYLKAEVLKTNIHVRELGISNNKKEKDLLDCKMIINFQRRLMGDNIFITEDIILSKDFLDGLVVRWEKMLEDIYGYLDENEAAAFKEGTYDMRKVYSKEILKIRHLKEEALEKERRNRPIEKKLTLKEQL